MDLNDHRDNGQEQEGERDPRTLPVQKSWAEIIADSNRKIAVMRQRIDELYRRVGQLTLERDEAQAVIARQEQEIQGLHDCLGWDDMVEEEKESCEPPPF